MVHRSSMACCAVQIGIVYFYVVLTYFLLLQGNRECLKIMAANFLKNVQYIFLTGLIIYLIVLAIGCLTNQDKNTNKKDWCRFAQCLFFLQFIFHNINLIHQIDIKQS